MKVVDETSQGTVSLMPESEQVSKLGLGNQNQEETTARVTKTINQVSFVQIDSDVHNTVKSIDMNVRSDDAIPSPTAEEKSLTETSSQSVKTTQVSSARAHKVTPEDYNFEVNEPS